MFKYHWLKYVDYKWNTAPVFELQIDSRSAFYILDEFWRVRLIGKYEKTTSNCATQNGLFLFLIRI